MNRTVLERLVSEELSLPMDLVRSINGEFIDAIMTMVDEGRCVHVPGIGYILAVRYNSSFKLESLSDTSGTREFDFPRSPRMVPEDSLSLVETKPYPNVVAIDAVIAAVARRCPRQDAATIDLIIQSVIGEIIRSARGYGRVTIKSFGTFTKADDRSKSLSFDPAERFKRKLAASKP